MEISVAITRMTDEQMEPPQAGPLPVKRGEIGFVEGQTDPQRNRPSSPQVPLPPRHPADRDAGQERPADSQASTSTPSAPSPSTPDSSTKQQKKHLLGLFKCHLKENPRKLAGITVWTLVRFILHILLIAGTIAVWVFVTLLLNRNDRLPGGASTVIFIHVLFGIAVLGQLFFLERCVFQLRVERYTHLHPGELLPSFRNRRTAPPATIALSPWNRPPIPTYAAALAQSGAGTGDVEDHIIAQPPPPAYGQTRGSVFLLSGPLNDNIRAQRPPSVHSVSSMPPRHSYASRDEEWEVIRDAERARYVEETLARLERAAT